MARTHFFAEQDVDEEYVILFLVSDENQSDYLQTNIDKYGGDPDNEVSEERREGRCNGFGVKPRMTKEPP